MAATDKARVRSGIAFLLMAVVTFGRNRMAGTGERRLQNSLAIGSDFLVLSEGYLILP